MRILVTFLFLLVFGCGAEPPQADDRSGSSATEQFRATLLELADAWNQGDASRAAECFTVDAVYSEPPDKQLYRGRDALHRFFGGDSGRPGQMHMHWHHIAFNDSTKVGFGEFSFSYGGTVHGVAVVRMRDGKISNWREYWYESSLP